MASIADAGGAPVAANGRAENFRRREEDTMDWIWWILVLALIWFLFFRQPA
jgi:hypothetical protein